MWFANNVLVENAILGFAAKYSERYGTKLYALALEGNHIQGPAHFPNGNRADFMRDFNSNTARAVARYTGHYPGGRLFGRRYSNEFLSRNQDIEEYFFYTVLQPIQDGLVPKLSEYPFYNCFNDAVKGIGRKVTVINWTGYYIKKRYNKSTTIKEFTETYILKYPRLPGYEHLTQKEYSNLMHQKLEERRIEIVRQRLAEGKGFVGREKLLQVVPGTPAKNPKKSTRESHRPRVLSKCPVAREEDKAWYFDKHFAYKFASKLYREGDLTVKFPDGMYPPYRQCELPP